MKKLPVKIRKIKETESWKRYRVKNLIKINEKAKLKKRKLWMENPDLLKQKQREYRFNLRVKTINMYGGICVCCGEKELKFLSFDHMNGGGNAEKIKKNIMGSRFYNFLRKEKQKDIQVLCYNCNLSKGFYGECPHAHGLPPNLSTIF